MGEEKKKARVDSDQNTEAFYSNNVAIFNNPTEFLLDFGQVTPRINMVQEKQVITYVVKHNPVALEPRQAKILLNLLQENIEKYEKQYGKIKVPKGKKKEQEALAKKFSDYIG